MTTSLGTEGVQRELHTVQEHFILTFYFNYPLQTYFYLLFSRLVEQKYVHSFLNLWSELK